MHGAVASSGFRQMKPATPRYNRRMAIARQDGETVVRFTGRVAWYYLLAVSFCLLVVILLLAALGYATEPSNWKKDFGAGLACLGSALFAGFIAFRLIKGARVYSRAWVAAGPGGVRMQLVNFDGSVEWGEGEVQFPWEKICGVTVENGECRFTAAGHSYTLTRKNCPSPDAVARLLMKARA